MAMTRAGKLNNPELINSTFVDIDFNWVFKGPVENKVMIHKRISRVIRSVLSSGRDINAKKSLIIEKFASHAMYSVTITLGSVPVKHLTDREIVKLMNEEKSPTVEVESVDVPVTTKPEPDDIKNIREATVKLIKEISEAKNDKLKHRAATKFMGICDTILTSANRTGALVSAFGQEMTQAKLNHLSLIGLVSGDTVSSDQRHYVKTMAIVLMSTYTPAGREQIRKVGINYAEIERVIGSDRFGALHSFLSGE